MREGIGRPRERLLSCIGTENVVFCSGDNAPTHFRNLQKVYLACRERDTLQTRYPLWYTVFDMTTTNRERFPINLQGCTENFCGFDPSIAMSCFPHNLQQ